MTILEGMNRRVMYEAKLFFMFFFFLLFKRERPYLRRHFAARFKATKDHARDYEILYRFARNAK